MELLMKHFYIVLLALLLISSFGMGQIPKLMSHQGYIADSTGVGVTATLPMTFRLYSDSLAGSLINTQTFPGVNLTKGVFNVNLDVSTVTFTTQYWLETEVNGQTLAPRTRLTSAPYALRALSLLGSGSSATGVDASAGGNSATASGDYSTVGGGQFNIASGEASTVGGGSDNDAGGNHSTVGGGLVNISNGFISTIGGGESNNATGDHSTVGGGEANTADGYFSTVSGGSSNLASGNSSTVIGGGINVASGNYSTVVGGHSNVASGTYSLAGGNKAKANHDGTFIWGDNTASDFVSTAVNQFLIRASGGVGIGTNTPSNQLSVVGNADVTGNVGIGTSTPSQQLEITRNFRLPASTDTTGIIMSGSNRYIHSYGSNNFFAGVNAGNLTLTGAGNTGMGVLALTANTSGASNTAVGDSAMFSNTTGGANTAIGRRTLRTNTTGSFNTALGRNALMSNTTGINNTALGERSMTTNTTGTDNVAVGNAALGFANTSGSYNTAIGVAALDFNTTGNYNTAGGYMALYSNTSGFNNAAVGDSALHYNTTGNSNTALGHNAGVTVTTGSNLTMIGNNAQPSSAIATNQITLGNSSVTTLRCNVTTITSLSDARDKKNIQDLSLGLDFIAKLKPRQYNWDKREWYPNKVADGSKMQKMPTAGFIAQELDEAQTAQNAEWLNLVFKDNPEKWEATWGNLLPVMVKAIQELREENIQLKSENAGMKTHLARIDELETLVKLLVADQQRHDDNKSLLEEVK